MITLEDAIAALEYMENTQEFDGNNMTTLYSFLNILKSKVEPLTIPTDKEGYILEGAYQNGFDSINDDATLFIVSGAKLIAHIKKQRRIASGMAGAVK